MRRGEPVGERLAWPDRWLGEVVHAVHVVAQSETVPMDGGVLRKVVAERDLDDVAFGDSLLASRHDPVVGPGQDRGGTELQGRRRSPQVEPANPRARRCPGLLGGRHRRVTRADRDTTPSGPGRTRVCPATASSKCETACAQDEKPSTIEMRRGHGKPLSTTPCRRLSAAQYPAAGRVTKLVFGVRCIWTDVAAWLVVWMVAATRQEANEHPTLLFSGGAMRRPGRQHGRRARCRGSMNH